MAAWLAQHPEIELISRDRHGLYADGARRGHPKPDKLPIDFHLALNLTEAVEKELARHRSFLSIPKPPGTSAAPLEGDASCPEVVIDRQRIAQGRRVAKQAQFEMMRPLHVSRRTVSSIVRETELGRKQVTAWVGLVELPERNQMEPNPRTPYLARFLAPWRKTTKTPVATISLHQKPGRTLLRQKVARPRRLNKNIRSTTMRLKQITLFIPHPHLKYPVSCRVRNKGKNAAPIELQAAAK